MARSFKGWGDKYSGSDDLDKIAWTGLNSGGETHDVGLKIPNSRWIYDMCGNVWEWLWDCLNDKYCRSAARGGSYVETDLSKFEKFYDGCFSSCSIKAPNIGFRVVRTAECHTNTLVDLLGFYGL